MGVYSGQVDAYGKAEGIGRYITQMGDIIEGQFLNGRPYGWVRAVSQKEGTSSVYTGLRQGYINVYFDFQC